METAIMIAAFIVFGLGAIAPQFIDDESVRPEPTTPKKGNEK